MKLFYKAFIGIICLGLLYTAIWFYGAYKVDQEITRFIEIDAPASGVVFYGDVEKISGFPGKFKAKITKGFAKDNITVTFPEAFINAFPIPGTPITLIADQGIYIKDDYSKKIFELDAVTARANIPNSFPRYLREKELREWKEKSGTIDVQNLELRKGTMKIIAEGTLGLDDNLQPDIYLNSRVHHYQELINLLVSTGELKPLPAAIAISALNAMVQTDSVTGESYARFDIKLQNQQLSLGPVKLVRLPPIQWNP